MALTKVSGDFIDAGSITQAHLHTSHGITTTHIAEGNKLFFTNARVDSRVGSLSTSNLSEGTNLYYTDARADARIAAADTGDLSEGTNLYYTQARFNTAFTAKSTSDLSEGTNLYYTDARADARITAADTDSLSEGSTNLYYTDARADARVALIVDSAPGTLNTLNELAAALGDDANFSTTVTNSIALKAPLASPTFTGSSHFTGNVELGDGTNKSMDASANGQLMIDGNGYQGAITLNADGMHIYHNSSARSLVLGTNETARLTISGSGNATFAGTITASGYNDANWNTAYSWGNHASGGYAADNAVVKLTGNQSISGTKKFSNSSLVIEGTHGTISFMDTTSAEDNFYIHVNSNNFYVLADRDGSNTIDGGYETPHPLQLEGDTNTAYVFGSALNISNWNTAYGWGNHASGGYLTSSTGFPKGTDIPGSANLNNYTNPGYYHQNGNSNATSGTNYPANLAGMLTVTADGVMVYQTYQAYGANHTWERKYYNGTWYSWHQIYDSGVFTNNSANWNTAYGWGNHASAGYAASATTLAGYGITNAIQKGAEIASGASWTTATKFASTGDLSQAAGNHALSVKSENNNDAFMSFHIGSDYAVHFGLDGASNRMHVGGWSDGTGTQYQLYDARDFSVASVLNSNVTLATLGYTGATNANYITNNNQLTNGAGYTTNTGTLTNSNDRFYLTDTRSAARAPSYYDDRYIQGDFSQSSNFGVSGGDAWAGILTVSKWSSWDATHRQEQLIFAGTKISRRVATSDTAWSSTYDIIDTSGVNNAKAGYIQSNASLRAPIFYDSDDTNSYFDANRIIMRGGDPTIIMRDTNHNSAMIHVNSNRWYVLRGGNDTGSWSSIGGVWPLYIELDTNDAYFGRHIFALTSMRAPIFYDRDNTGYYTDPASTSNLNTVTSAVISGNVTASGDGQSNYPFRLGADYNAYMMAAASNTWGLFWAGNSGARYGTNGNSGPGNIWGNSTNPNEFVFVGGDATAWTVHGGSGNVWLRGYGTAASSYRAPIFYDSDNTGYYLNPASTSNLNAGTLQGTWTMSTQHALVADNYGRGVYGIYSASRFQHVWSMGTAYNLADSGTSTGNLYGIAWSHQNAGGIASNLASHGIIIVENGTFKGSWGGGRLVTPSDIRATLYYDYSNTAYYGDPGGTSLLNAATINYINYKNSNFRVGNSTTMNAITSGGQNVAFGPEALGACNTGTRNFAYGYAALAALTSGANNIAMGDATGYNVTTGSNNLLFGVSAGRTGYQSPQSIAGVTSHNHQIHMGNESHTTARIQISWTVNSDARDKTDITPIDIGLEFVKQLNPVTYRWDKRSDYEDRTPDGTNKLPELTLGFLAQEVEVVEKSFGYDVANQTNLVVDRIPEQDHYGITYEKMVPILTKAIQEQQTIIDDLKSRLETLENQ